MEVVSLNFEAKKLENALVFSVYTQSVHPMEVVSLSFEDLKATLFA